VGVQKETKQIAIGVCVYMVCMMYIYICMQACVCVCIACVWVCKFYVCMVCIIYMYVCMYVCMYVYMYVCMYVCILCGRVWCCAGRGGKNSNWCCDVRVCVTCVNVFVKIKINRKCEGPGKACTHRRGYDAGQLGPCSHNWSAHYLREYFHIFARVCVYTK